MKRERDSLLTGVTLLNLPLEVFLHIVLTAKHPDGEVLNRRDLIDLVRLRRVCHPLLHAIDDLVLPRVTRLHRTSFSVIGYTNAVRFTGLDTLHVCSVTPSYVPRLLVTRLTRLRTLHIGQVAKQSRLNDMRLGTLTQLTELTISKRLGGMELAPLTNLITLALNDNGLIRDATLSRLTKLTALNLSRNRQISDEALSTLTSLTNLVLIEQTRITDTSLSLLTRLSSLALGDNSNITDRSLSCLTSLTFLSLDENRRISDDGLVCLTNLTFLEAGWTARIGDRSLSRLTALTNLSLGSNREEDTLEEGVEITDAAIASLTNLLRLTLRAGSNSIGDRGLSRLTTLTWLELRENVLVTDAALASLTGLTWLDVTSTTQIHTLEKLTALRDLTITKSMVHAETVSHLTALEILKVRSHSVGAITRMHLEHMSRLVRLAMKTPEFLSPSLYNAIIDRGGVVTR